MENISNEQDAQNIDYLSPEAQNDLIENLDLNQNMNINNMESINPNYVNYENYSGEINEFNLDKNNLDVENTQKVFVQTLNLQINQLQKLLNEKNKEFDVLNQENGKMKLLIIQEQKKLIDKDNIIHTLTSDKKNLEEKIKKYENESDNMKNTIKDLNYKLIELNQNLTSKENINQFNDKIKNIIESNINNINANRDQINDSNNNNFEINEKIGIEMIKLNNVIDELEVKNNKLSFENKILNNKIETMNEDKNNEIGMYKSIYQTQINNLNKIISNLNSRISEFFSENNTVKISNKMNNLISQEIIEKFNALENKLNLYDKENSELRKENQNIKSELDELKLVADSKEKIIEKLQSDFEMMENEYNNSNNNTPQLRNINNNNNIDYSQYINELLNKQKILEKENYNLRNGLKQMANNINEANDIYFKRKSPYDNNIKIRDNKLKEYKSKISLLKMKINELHQEISNLKGSKGRDININDNNHNSFLSHNNDINNQFKIDQHQLMSQTPKIRRKDLPFEINKENKNNNENFDNNDIFGDIKLSEKQKIKKQSIENNNEPAFNDNQQDLKYIQEYKDILNKVDEQFNKFN